VIRDGVQVNGAGEKMQALSSHIRMAEHDIEAFTYLDEGVVQDKHHGSGIPCPLLAPEQHLPNVAHVSHFGMAQTEFPIPRLAS
jgi:hypothetical protein